MSLSQASKISSITAGKPQNLTYMTYCCQLVVANREFNVGIAAAIPVGVQTSAPKAVRAGYGQLWRQNEVPGSYIKVHNI
jgi:hypothetical protein